MELLEG
jgi:serine/threonine protein kinase